jgi:hypothetical protein
MWNLNLNTSICVRPMIAASLRSTRPTQVLRTTWLRLAEACAKLANRAATVKAQKS